jgi:hypothetical protein
MARPGQAIAATLSRIVIDIYPKRDVMLGSMPLSPENKEGEWSLNHTGKKMTLETPGNN